MFANRSQELELLDQENIPTLDLYQNLRELAFINQHLGGDAVTIKGIKKLLAAYPQKTYHIVDIGCGGGDTLKIIAQWGRENNFNFQLTGVDLKEDAIHYAKANCEAFPEIQFIQSDYRYLNILNLPDVDIFTSSLFCHHLSNEAIVELMQWMQQNAQIGFLINDLERQPLAYYSIKLLTKLFSKSYLVKNDAPISVKRGFKRQEFLKLCEKANLNSYTLHWCWAFRWLLVGYKNAK